MLHTRLTPATGFSASTLHPHRGHLILLCAEFGVEEVIVAQVSQCTWYGVWCGAGGRHFPGPIRWAHEPRVQGTPCQNWEPPRAANLPQAVERQLIQPGGHTCAGWASSYEEHGVGLHGAKVSPLGGHRRLSVEKKTNGHKTVVGINRGRVMQHLSWHGCCC